MRKCSHCGFITRTRRKLRQHMRECEYGQNKAGPAKGRETEEELVEAQIDEKPVEAEIEAGQDEGIDYNDMNRMELIDLLEAEGHTGIRRFNKPDLVDIAIKSPKEGE